MENRIINIETYRNDASRISFVGLLRNAKKFELNQKVFISSEGKMVQCRIVGVELPPVDNPEYKYKVELPKDFVSKENERVSLTCNYIFSTIEEAKESAMAELDKNYKLNKENIERYFKKYEI